MLQSENASLRVKSSDNPLQDKVVYASQQISLAATNAEQLLKLVLRY